MSDADLLTLMGTDGQAWAKQWIATAAEIVARGAWIDVLDEGWMIGWFANAIEAGRGAANRDWAVRLTALEPCHDTGMGDVICSFCGSTDNQMQRTSNSLSTWWLHTHEPDCTWIRACLHLGPIPDGHTVRDEHA